MVYRFRSYSVAVICAFVVATIFLPATFTQQQTGHAQGSVVYNAIPAFYENRQVFYYVFNNGTPILNQGATVGVVDQYRLVNEDGEPIEGQFDIIPTGGVFSETYSDLREIVEVMVDSDYVANTYTSEEALQAAGLLEADNIRRTGQARNMPLVLPGAQVQGNDHGLIQLWENERMRMAFDFGETPAATAPIYLLVTDGIGTRLDGISSVIEQMHADEGYSDFWQVFEVRVPADVDPNSIRSVAQIVDAGYPITETPNVVNCPAIRLEHMSRAYLNDTLYHITRTERADLPFDAGLPTLYALDDSDMRPILEYGPEDEDYTGVCQQVNVTTDTQPLNADGLRGDPSAETVFACSVLAEVLPNEAE